jgi:hypothetical protein
MKHQFCQKKGRISQEGESVKKWKGRMRRYRAGLAGTHWNVVCFGMGASHGGKRKDEKCALPGDETRGGSFFRKVG